jgi:N6-adenosine-specific RNA methylase IME4/ParB-like chromosome segregation protein Spo0J
VPRHSAVSAGEAVAQVDPGSLRAHPLAAAVPAMAAREFQALREDVRRHGVVVPLEVTPELVLLDGRQRLAAAIAAGTVAVPVRVVEVVDALDYMLRAAILRRNLSSSQRAALAVDLDAHRQRVETGRVRRLGNLRQNRPEVAALPPRGRSRDAAAEWAGVSARTIQDVIAVQQHDPVLFERLKSGEVQAALAARRVRRTLRDKKQKPAGPLPEGPFDVLYGDPPWQLGNPDGRWAPENHYSTLPPCQICALSPPSANDAILFLWVPPSLIPTGLEVMKAWGFSHIGEMVWVKPSIGLGNTVRFQHEPLLIGRKGNFRVPEPEDRPSSVVTARRGRHSEKPKVFYDLIERMYPDARRLELFARNPRAGWARWGNEANP